MATIFVAFTDRHDDPAAFAAEADAQSYVDRQNRLGRQRAPHPPTWRWIALEVDTKK